MNCTPLRKCIASTIFRCARHLNSVKYPKSVKLAYQIHDFEQTSTGSWEIGSLGNKDNAPLLVLHGLFGCKHNWHSVAMRLADIGHRLTKGRGVKITCKWVPVGPVSNVIFALRRRKPMVITVDTRNHGNSEHNPYMDYYVMRDDIFRLMDELHLEQVILVGHSMGGKVAMSLALTEPERLKALVVVDVAPEVSPGGTLLLTYAERMKQIVPDPHAPVSKARKEAETKLRPIVETPLVRNFLLTNLVEKQGQVRWRLNLDAIIENYYNILDFPEFAHPFLKPTKFIAGSLSHHITEEKIPEIKRLFPAADITHIPGAGHWVHSENPPEFVTLLSEFLDNLS